MSSDTEHDAAEEMQDLLDAGASGKEPFVVAGRRLAPARVIEILRPVMREARLERIRAVVAERTRTVVPVVEGLVNTGNVSAVMRSAEALGYQDFHVVRGENERFKHSERTSRGAEKWIDLMRWEAPQPCIDYFHARDYTVVATHLDERAVPIGAIDFTEKTALVFGNEKDGISPAMQEAVDQTCIIPITGFTESFNVSVAAALALYHAQRDRIDRQGHHADLSAGEQTRLVARFCMRSVRNAEAILRRAVREGERGEEEWKSG